jgi:hypothetical protein
MSTIPEGAKLHPNYDRALIESDAYEHWTKATLLEFLEDVPDDASVWIGRVEDGDDVLTVRPVEYFTGGSEVIFG